jgi:hypothetical protein
MNQQEATRAMIVCGLRAGPTKKMIVSCGNINEITVYIVERKFEKFFASGGSVDTVLTGRKGTVLTANLDELITRNLGRSSPPPTPPPTEGDEDFQNM